MNSGLLELTLKDSLSIFRIETQNSFKDSLSSLEPDVKAPASSRARRFANYPFRRYYLTAEPLFSERMAAALTWRIAARGIEADF